MLKIATRRKHELWVSGNRHEAKRCQVELNNLIKRSKVVYKNKIERCFEENDSKSAWKSLKTITGYKKKPSNVGERNDNEFYSRFEKNDNILDVTENPLTRLQVKPGSSIELSVHNSINVAIKLNMYVDIFIWVIN
ncbi:hypothetical protein CAPTEDRAFT_192773 [Capitella teleta]|uniref:Uncharacterized protein n=1 Tax=Capitella teleta TaxID=283909 RepID=R7VHI4_CAPTE|nr:hypothetical protein CAPTEDRAFT_192773 [Capitella teleta]|eukprot:ELU18079.1 hypothetical protein CAPTEDRAFT_192773 [Capitella teleta]